jgi:hypothetical protein
MEESRHCQNLTVIRRLVELSEAHGEKPRPHDVIEKVRLRVLTRVLDGARNQRRVGHDNTCHQARCDGPTHLRLDGSCGH